MKKVLIFMLTASLLFTGLVGCGSDKKDDKKSSENPKTSDKTSDKDPSSEEPNEIPKDAKALELQYGDYYTLDNVKVIVSKNESVVKGSGNNIIAKKLTSEPVGVAVHYNDGTVENYAVTVKKAKIAIMLVCGQSNASGETSGVKAEGMEYKCDTVKPGVAYLWGAASSSPTAYVGGTQRDGFRAALASEWYEQSKAAGDPQKVCLVFQTDYTATPGEKIGDFLDDGYAKSTVAKSVKMLNACYDYYATGAGKENFEIASCGMYWLQGESDRGDTVAQYEGKFNNLWSRFKTETGNKLKYCGIMRVRIKDGYDNLGLEGPALSQQNLVNNNADIYMASRLTENWGGKATDIKSVDISKYHIFDETQYDEIVSGTTLNAQLQAIYGGLHYSPLGYNLIGADAAVNMYAAIK